MQKKQKGQSIVEFALVLPLFMIFVFGMIYIGMIMADYLTLSNVARSSAREVAITKSIDVRKNYENVKLPFDIFIWNATDSDKFKINYDNNSHNVKVNITADLNIEGLYWRSIVNKMTGGTSLPKIDIEYIMYSEQ